MKFWVIQNAQGSPCGCELTKAAAIETARKEGNSGFSLRWLDIPVSSESIRLILGNGGGYANEVGRTEDFDPVGESK
jgi:hypothetical protein